MFSTAVLIVTKNPNWSGGWPVDYLQSVEEFWDHQRQIHLEEEGGFELGTSGLQTQRPDHWAPLPAKGVVGLKT